MTQQPEIENDKSLGSRMPVLSVVGLSRTAVEAQVTWWREVYKRPLGWEHTGIYWTQIQCHEDDYEFWYGILSYWQIHTEMPSARRMPRAVGAPQFVGILGAEEHNKEKEK